MANTGGPVWKPYNGGPVVEFEASSSSYCSLSLAKTVTMNTATGFTLIVHVNREESTSASVGFPFALGNSAVSGIIVGFDFRSASGHAGYIRDTTSGGPLNFGSTAATTGVYALVSRNTTLHETYHAGRFVNSSTTFINTISFDRIAVGCVLRSTASLFYDGDVSTAMLWTRALKRSEIKHLAIDPLAPFRRKTKVSFFVPAAPPATSVPKFMHHYKVRRTA